MALSKHLLVASLILPLLGGCMFKQLQAAEKLRDSVLGLNEEMRWNRMDLARERVVPLYQVEFAQRVRNWHRDIQIANTEILRVEVGESREDATSLVDFEWYNRRTMTMSQTSIRQFWRRGPSGYYLWEMEIVGGDPSLLAELPHHEEVPAATPAADPATVAAR